MTPVPYDPRRRDALLAFIEGHLLSPVFSLPARRMIDVLAAKDGVLEVRVGGHTALVGVVVDGCDNLHDAAILEVLGWNRDVSLASLLPVVEPAAVAIAARAGRSCVSLALPERLGKAVPAGWLPAEDSLVMERPARLPPLEIPPCRGVWEDLRVSGVDEHYAVVRASFADDPSTFIPPFATFSSANVDCTPPVRVLRIRGVEAGFVRTSFESRRIGHVASIGRAPSFRGEGLGPVILAEALRLLAVRRGIQLIRLGVTASNGPAVALYTRSGFATVERWRTWRRAA